MSENLRVVIVGGVAGGMSAATRLRRLLENASITVVERSGHVSYANCGLPYHVGGVIEDREELLLQTPESLHRRFRLDVRVRNEAVSIDRDAKTIQVRDLATGKLEQLEWDALILSPGAQPAHLPIPGGDRAQALRTVEDADFLTAASIQARTAAIMGGGFIGLEIAENLKQKGIEVAVVEASNQVMAPLDVEMAELVHEHLRDQGVDLHLGRRATEITTENVILDDGKQIRADLVISAIGVRPETNLAREADLKIGEFGGIITDEFGRTSDPNIYAIGDATEAFDRIGNRALIPLAGPANRQGRLIADVIAGRDARVPASLGTAIVGLFGMQIASTGRNERTLRAAGITPRIIHTHPLNHAGYYPGAETLHLKLLIDPETDQILGAQAIGRDGADKRIDVLATAMRAGMHASDLIDLDLTYSPQFGSAKDPINMLGYIANNLREQTTESIQWHELSEAMSAGTQLIDVRSADEHKTGSIPGAVNIDLDTLRDNLEQVQQNAIVHCAVGLRGHIAVRLLAGHGIQARNLDGGYETWRAGSTALSAQTGE